MVCIICCKFFKAGFTLFTYNQKEIYIYMNIHYKDNQTVQPKINIHSHEYWLTQPNSTTRKKCTFTWIYISTTKQIIQYMVTKHCWNIHIMKMTYTISFYGHKYDLWLVENFLWFISLFVRQHCCVFIVHGLIILQYDSHVMNCFIKW